MEVKLRVDGTMEKFKIKKSKNEKTITNKMLKFIHQTDKDNQKRRLELN